MGVRVCGPGLPVGIDLGGDPAIGGRVREAPDAPVEVTAEVADQESDRPGLAPLPHVLQLVGQQTAAALTWVTLFALVPMLTVFYSILSLVPGFQALGDQLQTLVFQHFVPSTGAEIQQYLAGFAEQARKLTLAGTLMLDF